MRKNVKITINQKIGRIVKKVKVIKTTLITQDQFDRIISCHPAKKLSEIKVSSTTRDLILKELEKNFNVKISGPNREEIITVQDIFTAVLLQKIRI